MKAEYTDKKQQRVVYERDGGMCQMEKLYDDVWIACWRPSKIRAHIYPRHHGGADKFHPDLVVTACDECHSNFDDRNVPRTYPTRVPAEREQAAYDRIAVRGARPPRKDLEGRTIWRQEDAQ